MQNQIQEKGFVCRPGPKLKARLIQEQRSQKAKINQAPLLSDLLCQAAERHYFKDDAKNAGSASANGDPNNSTTSSQTRSTASNSLSGIGFDYVQRVISAQRALLEEKQAFMKKLVDYELCKQKAHSRGKTIARLKANL